MTPSPMPHADGDVRAPCTGGARGSRPTRYIVRVACALGLAAMVLGASPAVVRAATLTQLKSQLAAIRKDAAPAGADYERAVTQLEDTRYRIKLTDGRIKAQTTKLGIAETRLASRVDALYRAGGDDSILSFVLGSSSWDDFITRIEYATIIAANDASLVEQVRASRAGLQADKAALSVEAKAEAKQVATLKVRKDAMEAKLASKRAEYNRVLGLIAAKMARENPGHGSYPAGPNGMVFPVRGVHFYSNTWGAPRSGGRRHMGTDIMSPRGTPIVAVSSGSARVHSSSLGGKSITLTGSNGWSYYFAHLDRYAVKSGHVKAGQVIGYVGNSGNARGGPSHLHFQMGPRERWVNPYSYLRAME